MEKKRLAKYLAASGIASRRKCEELIFEGRVKIGGKVIQLPQTLVDGTEKITVDRKEVRGEESKVYFILNKPSGYLCSPVDGSTKRMVLDLFADQNKRLFTVGRLDKETTGMLIVTNDGAFANRVIHPSSGVQKEYIAKTNHEITDEHLKIISAGTEVDGTYVRPIKVVKMRKGTLKVIVGDGKKREVRCLIEAANLEVKELKRVRIGGLTLGDLPLGTWRVLTEKERKQIFQ